MTPISLYNLPIHLIKLANLYANRIVRVKDGHILDDSNPFELNDKEIARPEHKNMGKSSLSFLTSLALSFNNLKTKKGRTFLIAFAGSIEIILIVLSVVLTLIGGFIPAKKAAKKDPVAALRSE